MQESREGFGDLSQRDFPHVTTQLPIFNEIDEAVERLAAELKAKGKNIGVLRQGTLTEDMDHTYRALTLSLSAPSVLLFYRKRSCNR